MRALLSATAAILCVTAFSSCSNSELTKGDIRTFKLSDLTRFGQPRIVKISREDLERLDMTEKEVDSLTPNQKDQLARHIANEVAGPIDFDPPALPGTANFDGSILPPKSGDDTGPGPLVSTPVDSAENFSIE